VGDRGSLILHAEKDRPYLPEEIFLQEAASWLQNMEMSHWQQLPDGDNAFLYVYQYAD
jgi:hypothetical protein